MKKTSIIFSIAIILTLSLATLASAQGTVPSSGGAINPPSSGGAQNPASNTSFPKLESPLIAKNLTDLLTSVVDVAIVIGMVMAVLVFMYIGFKFVTAQGDPKAISDAKMWFLYAVIGTALLLSAKVIVYLVRDTLISAGVVNEKILK